MATAGEKFMKSVKMREWASIERYCGTSMADLMSPGALQAELTIAMATTAKRRLDMSFKYTDAEELGMEDVNALLTDSVAALGFEDDPEMDEDEAADFTDKQE